jgi:hypothetical protein
MRDRRLDVVDGSLQPAADHYPMNEESAKLEAWCEGCLRKRSPDAIRILMDLLQAGLKNGHTTANDVRIGGKLAEPNIIGCVFRSLKGLGFRVDRETYRQACGPQKHGRYIPTWRLVERWKAEAVLRKFNAVLIGSTTEPSYQRELGL